MMRSLSRNFLVAILTFLIGIGTTLSLRTLRRVPNEPATNQDSPLECRVESPPAAPQIRDIATGKAAARDGTPASFTSFDTLEGNRFLRWSEYHDSPRRARLAMDSALKHATKIIRREPLFDNNGQVVGEKAIATFSGKYTYYGYGSLLWTDGSTFRYVAGSSLQNIFDYELTYFNK
jgi:hypothetical protein